jgi:hypothetical protein
MIYIQLKYELQEVYICSSLATKVHIGHKLN